MTDNDKQLTIVIPTFGREEVLVDTIENVLSHMDHASMELVVVDQTPAHKESTRQKLEQWHREGLIQWICVKWRSVCAARNLALVRSSSEFLVFLDDDLRIGPQFFQEHLSLLKQEGVDAVVGQYHNCISPDQIPPLDHPELNTTPAFPPDFGKGLVGRFCTANSSIGRQVMLDIGGFDENFIGPSTYEDSDVGRRLAALGGKIVYSSRAWIIHQRASSGGTRIAGAKHWPEWNKSANFALYAFRHGPRIGEFWMHIWGSLRAGPLLRGTLLWPWRWPWAWVSWLCGLAYGWHHRNRMRSGLTGNVEVPWRTLRPKSTRA